MAIIGVPMLLGPILGPILGGWLVDDFSWRWIFFINLPIGIAALVLSQRILARDVPQPGHRLDWLGLALLSPGLAALIYGLAETSGAGGFASAEVIVPGLIGVAMLAAFVRHGLRTPDALIDLRLFANRVFSAASRDADPRHHRRVRRHAAAAALPPGRARRDGDGHRPAARPAGPRRDGRDADRGAPRGPHRRRADRPRRARASSASRSSASPSSRPTPPTGCSAPSCS